MSAVLKVFTGGTAGRVRKHEDALTKRRDRLPHLEADVEKAARSFEETADASALTAAERALEDAQREITRHEGALADAQRDLAAEEAEQAARETEARYADHRVKAGKLGTEITETLVSLGRLLSSHELVDALPAGERFRFWPPTYCETASRQVSTPEQVARPGGTRTITLEIVVPLVV